MFVNREQAKIWTSISREELSVIQPTLSNHYDILRAYADGEEIESRDPMDYSCGWKREKVDRIFFHDSLKYRVKPNDAAQSSEPWKPKYGERCFYIYGSGKVIGVNFHNELIDNDHVSFGNCFHTQEEAEAALERVRAALKNETVYKIKTVESLDDKPLTGNEKALLRHLRDSKVVDIFNGETATTVVFDNEKNNAYFAEAIECIMWSNDKRVK